MSNHRARGVVGASGGPRVDLRDDRRGSSDADGADPISEDSFDELGSLLSAVLAAEGCGPDAEAGLHLVDVSDIADLNARHMGVDGPTDVLSFPIDGPVTAPARGGAPVLVGDVVICPEVAAAQAEAHTGTFDDECRLLVVHGALHLCGWDHADARAQRAMWERERALMAEFQLLPARDPWTTR